MSLLVSCPECKNTVSDTTLRCPHCGVKLRRYKQVQLIAFSCLAFFIFILIRPFDNTTHSNSRYQSYQSKPPECEYLNTQGIYTGEYYSEEDVEAKAAKRMGIPYEKDINAEYVCLSDYIGVGNSKQNTIAYYAYGNSSEKIEKVVLTLGVTDKSDEALSLNEYQEYIAVLFKEHTGTSLNKQYLAKIRHRQPFSKIIGNYKLSMKKNGNNRQYGLTTEIKKIK